MQCYVSHLLQLCSCVWWCENPTWWSETSSLLLHCWRKRCYISYKCTGANVINHWGVDEHSISEYPLNFSLSNSLVDCVNTLKLTLYDVTLDHPTIYTAYPSSAERIDTTGVHITYYLSELFFDGCMCMVNMLSLLCSVWPNT